MKIEELEHMAKKYEGPIVYLVKTPRSLRMSSDLHLDCKHVASSIPKGSQEILPIRHHVACASLPLACSEKIGIPGLLRCSYFWSNKFVWSEKVWRNHTNNTYKQNMNSIVLTAKSTLQLYACQCAHHSCQCYWYVHSVWTLIDSLPK